MADDPVTYHGRTVRDTEPVNDLMADLVTYGVPHELIEVDGAPAVAVGTRLRLYWDDTLGVFAGLVREWDYTHECVSDEWTPAEFLPHTSNSRWFVVRPASGVAAIAAGWKEP